MATSSDPESDIASVRESLAQMQQIMQTVKDDTLYRLRQRIARTDNGFKAIFRPLIRLVQDRVESVAQRFAPYQAYASALSVPSTADTVSTAVPTAGYPGPEPTLPDTTASALTDTIQPPVADPPIRIIPPPGPGCDFIPPPGCTFGAPTPTDPCPITCSPVVCPPGFHYDLDSGACVPDAPPPPTNGDGRGGGVIINGVCCYPGVPARIVSCVTRPVAPPPLRYWVSCRMTDCGHMETCVWQGDFLPQGLDLGLLWGPFDVAPPLYQWCPDVAPLCITGLPPGVPCPPTTIPPPDQITPAGPLAPSGARLATGMVPPVLPGGGNGTGGICPTPGDGGGNGKPGNGKTCPEGQHLDADGNCVPDDPTKKAEVCDKIDLSKLPLFDPSADDFCSNVVTYINTFANIGRTIQDIETQGMELIGGIGAILSKMKDLPLAGDFLGWLADNLLSVPQLIYNAGCLIKKLGDSPILDQSPVTLGLWFIKALITLMEEMEIGIDLVIKDTFRVTVELKQLRQIIDYLIDYANPVEVPGIADAFELYSQNFITFEQAICFSRMHGVVPKLAQLQMQARREKPTVHELVEVWRRGSRDPQELQNTLRNYGWLDPLEIDQIAQLAYETPTRADLLGYARREVFRQDKLGVVEMALEFEGEIGLRDMFAAGGVGPITINTDLTNVDNLPVTVRDNGDGTATWDIALMDWLEHYQEISPTQGYEMVHRLRPDRVERFKTFVPGVTVEDMLKLQPGSTVVQAEDRDGVYVIPEQMTSYTLAKLLRQLEYNPIWRARLEAISYRVIGRVDIRRIYAAGGFGTNIGTRGFDSTDPTEIKPTGEAEKEVAERYMDLGYTREDSNIQAYFTAKQYEDLVQNPIKKQLLNLICQGYQNGIFTEEQAVDEAYSITGDEQQAQLQIYRCNYDRRIKDIKTAIASIRKIYMRGEADEDETNTFLQKAGVSQDRQTELLRLWKLERAGLSKQMTAARFCDWYAKGLITIDEIYTRLTRMGWHEEDAQRAIKHCQLGILAKQQAEQEKLIKAQVAAEEKRQKALQKLRDQERKELERRQKQWVSLETEANLKAWWRAGWISRDQVGQILVGQGANPQDVMRWMGTFLKP